MDVFVIKGEYKRGKRRKLTEGDVEEKKLIYIPTGAFGTSSGFFSSTFSSFFSSAFFSSTFSSFFSAAGWALSKIDEVFVSEPFSDSAGLVVPLRTALMTLKVRWLSRSSLIFTFCSPFGLHWQFHVLATFQLEPKMWGRG